MRIGSLHRMGKLDPNFITLKDKKLNVASFFSGLITAKYWIVPNFVISAILNSEDNSLELKYPLVSAAKLVLESISAITRSSKDAKTFIELFDNRTTTMTDMLEVIGINHDAVLADCFEFLQSDAFFYDSDEVDEVLSDDVRAKGELEAKIIELEDQLKAKEGTIQMLQQMFEDLKGMSNQMQTSENIVDQSQKINELHLQINKLIEGNKLLKQRIEEHQDTITHLLDYKLIVQTRFNEYKAFISNIVNQMQNFLNNFEYF